MSSTFNLKAEQSLSQGSRMKIETGSIIHREMEASGSNLGLELFFFFFYCLLSTSLNSSANKCMYFRIYWLSRGINVSMIGGQSIESFNKRKPFPRIR